MKKLFTLIFLVFLFSMSCSEEEDSLSSSQIEVPAEAESELDQFIRENFTKPYNIDIQYRFNPVEVNANRYITPPQVENVRPVLDILLKAWIEPYNEIGGPNFIKKIAPKQFSLYGSFNVNPSGTITLGLAEAGVKISLFNIDYLDYSSINSIREPLRTVHHEYGHILNMTDPIPEGYGLVNPEAYSATWFNRPDSVARELGYITAYASSDPNEDFVEMICQMLIRSKDQFDSLIEDSIQNETAQRNIRIKEQMVVDYYDEQFNIDFYELQKVAYRNLEELVQ